MKAYRILAVAVLAAVIAGCSGAEFAEEKTVLTTATKAMEALTSAINGTDAPAEITKAVGAFSSQIEKLAPAMKKLTSEHPDWESDPPSELKDTMSKFKSASSDMQAAMPKLMKVAGENADDMELQGALKKFQSVVAGL